MAATPEESRWHERMLDHDVTVTAEISRGYLSLLIKHLRIRFPHVQDEHLLCDGASESLINYFKEPQNYKPAIRTLLGYLKMAAERDVKNLLAKQSRKKENESEFLVELGCLFGNSETEESNSERPSAAQFREIVLTLFPTSPDRELIELILDGVRETEPFAEILGLTDQPVEAQRNQVKRCKDRLKKQIQRHFEKNPL